MSRARWAMLFVLVIAAIAAERLLWPSIAFPSISTLWVAIDLAIAGRVRSRQTRRFVLMNIAVIGLLLYASVAGFLPLDLYRLGFSPWFAIALAVIGILLARWRPSVALLILIVLVSRDFSLLRSRNLFDYIVDPPIVGFAVLYGIALAMGALLRSARVDERRSELIEPAEDVVGELGE